MEAAQREIEFILNQSDAFIHAMGRGSNDNNDYDRDDAPHSTPATPQHSDDVDALVHQACDVRARLLTAMQCSGAMFDKNMQCVAYILALKKDSAAANEVHQRERDVLQGRVDSLVGIVEVCPTAPMIPTGRVLTFVPFAQAQQQKLASLAQALALKGLWQSMLLPYKKSFSGDAATLDVVGGVALAASSSSCSKERADDEAEADHAAVALCLLSAQFAKMIHDSSLGGGTRAELAATGAVAARSPGPAVFNALPAVAGPGRTPHKGSGASPAHSRPSPGNYRTFAPAPDEQGAARPTGEDLVARLLDKVAACLEMRFIRGWSLTSTHSNPRSPFAGQGDGAGEWRGRRTPPRLAGALPFPSQSPPHKPRVLHRAAPLSLF